MLSVEAVSKTFGGVRALRSASLACEAGEILGLIGPNGAGKSTLVNAISGVLKPDTGSVRLAGKEITGHGPEYCARAGVARTFQTIRLFKDLTVRQNVEVAHITCQAVRPEAAARIGVDQLLAQYQLDGFADVPAGTLSYGSQRRLEIARALALGPSLLLLDEPAAGLNEGESETLAVAIEGIRRDVGCATIVIDHDLRFINRLCDRLCVMDQGQVIASGQTEAVWRDPRVIEVYVGQSETS
ncbi:ABC transporter ATP-binding protein [Mesorhizobium sp. M7D.F.Ca.US.005.01.1.1]|uniref:ABC transporter ATP-binding protein n=1 Tax=Mesorhizobium sp. M7D.F.Ca.US.005.01.1.1 TaxID=2493678 RepID=UPI000F758B29|nr:ABC transporter ATP-binding protein [Mesorhizobium sp. M7D.F.Ca.US.005.01.1.1]AZO45013.1 ABC transporter ATP-binding protein [Mesorhizobium sp. M7D.F.Ca.US.005.01.1.1]